MSFELQKRNLIILKALCKVLIVTVSRRFRVGQNFHNKQAKYVILKSDNFVWELEKGTFL